MLVVVLEDGENYSAKQDYINADNAYKDAVNAIVSAGIMNGTSATVFAPNATANRGMSAAVMLRMYNLIY